MTADPTIRLAGDRDPWERQPRESQLMYARFAAYRDMGEGRTLSRVLEILTATGDRVGRGQLANTASSYRWLERSEAYDRDRDRLDRARLVELRRDMIERHRRTAQGLLALGLKALQHHAADPSAISPADLVRIIDLAVRIERAALVDPAPARVEVTGPAGGPIEVADFAHYTPHERAERLQAISAELARRAAATLGADDDD